MTDAPSAGASVWNQAVSKKEQFCSSSGTICRSMSSRRPAAAVMACTSKFTTPDARFQRNRQQHKPTAKAKAAISTQTRPATCADWSRDRTMVHMDIIFKTPRVPPPHFLSLFPFPPCVMWNSGPCGVLRPQTRRRSPRAHPCPPWARTKAFIAGSASSKRSVVGSPLIVATRQQWWDKATLCPWSLFPRPLRGNGYEVMK
jgi:hypothetical protein